MGATIPSVVRKFLEDKRSKEYPTRFIDQPQFNDFIALQIRLISCLINVAKGDRSYDLLALSKINRKLEHRDIEDFHELVETFLSHGLISHDLGRVAHCLISDLSQEIFG